MSPATQFNVIAQVRHLKQTTAVTRNNSNKAQPLSRQSMGSRQIKQREAHTQDNSLEKLEQSFSAEIKETDNSPDLVDPNAKDEFQMTAPMRKAIS